MQDDDWMIPRRLHTPQGERSEEPSENNRLQIDPQLLRQRELRKEKLLPQPNNTRFGQEPWSDIDRSIARGIPGYPEQMWTLGDTARWVIERTPQAVNGLSIDEGKLFEVLPEIHAALSDGEVSVFAHTKNDPVPRELPPETWFIYQLVVEGTN